VKSKIKERKFPIICPIIKCKKLIHANDISQSVSKEIFADYSNFKLERLVETHGDELAHCPGPDCPFIFAYDNQI